ncbi:MAG TPA: response regulator [Anaerolineales bacterium]|nr:response regulator [Anaerolineales bacterium]
MTKVWIVDDDDEMSQAVKLMLQMLNAQVEIYGDARAAARTLLDGVKPDVLILDINMPEVSGIDMLEFIRRTSHLKGLPVVMLSSETTDVQVDEAMAKGANAFVFKPVTIEELEAALRRALRPRAAR